MEEDTMKYRKYIRLKEYDYTQEGAYFITLCARNFIPLFGEIINSENRLNSTGRMIFNSWIKAEEMYKNITIRLRHVCDIIK